MEFEGTAEQERGQPEVGSIGGEALLEDSDFPMTATDARTGSENLLANLSGGYHVLL